MNKTTSAGEPVNFEMIWREYQNSVRGLLAAKLADPDQVDDLLQDVFIKVHRNLSSLKSEHSVKPWLFRITNNAIADFYRARDKSGDLGKNDLWYGNEPETESQLSQCIEPSIKALPKESADLLIAIDLQGQSQKEYAKRLVLAIQGLSPACNVVARSYARFLRNAVNSPSTDMVPLSTMKAIDVRRTIVNSVM